MNGALMAANALRQRRLSDTGVIGVYAPDTSKWSIEQYREALEEARKVTLYWVQLSAEQNTELRKLDASLPARVSHPSHPFYSFVSHFREMMEKRADSSAAKVYAGQVIDHLIYMIQNSRGARPFRTQEELCLWLESRKHTTA